ncbi:MAG: SUMF1/EgtB/PvdO family nonheme iron enzyme [Kiritimatiellae bacterium]|nr:SUMF1/EgtB/PvdO family nonheme iron enzyme [Kiritimatiellia bacterium]
MCRASLLAAALLPAGVAGGETPITLDLGEGQQVEFVWVDSLRIWVGKDEVTNGQFKRFDPKHDSEQSRGQSLAGERQPVVSVMLSDAKAFCGWLNARQGGALPAGFEARLPAESEWEAFAACGAARKYPWGDGFPPAYGNYDIEGYDDGCVVTCPVEASGENEWGLRGVGGNAAELCIPAGGEAQVLRGASWRNFAEDTLLISYRFTLSAERRNLITGFRVVLAPKGGAPEAAEPGGLAGEAGGPAPDAKPGAPAAVEPEEPARDGSPVRPEAPPGPVSRAALVDFEKPAERHVKPEPEPQPEPPPVPPPARAEAGPPAYLIVHLDDTERLTLLWVPVLRMWVGKFEVSNGEYRCFRPEHDSERYRTYSLNEARQPAVLLTWDDARAYCSWLNTQFGDSLPSGYVFRLPTEREWEVFAACGERREYAWGDAWPPPADWNYHGREGAGSWRKIDGHDDGFPVACPVDKAGRNDWGLYGVGGNVAEWCTRLSPAMQPSHVTCGASWFDGQENVLRVANRGGKAPNLRDFGVGFRVVAGEKR